MSNTGAKTYGRPCGKVKTAKIEIAIEPEIKKEFMRLLREEGFYRNRSMD